MTVQPAREQGKMTQQTRMLLLQVFLIPLALILLLVPAGMLSATNTLFIVLAATFLNSYRLWVLARYSPDTWAVYARIGAGDHLAAIVRALRNRPALADGWRKVVPELDELLAAGDEEIENASRCLRAIPPPLPKRRIPALAFVAGIFSFALGALLSTWLPTIDAMTADFVGLCDTDGVIGQLLSPLNLIGAIPFGVRVWLIVLVLVAVAMRLWNYLARYYESERFRVQTEEVLRAYLTVPRYRDALAADLEKARDLRNVSPQQLLALNEIRAASEVKSNRPGWRRWSPSPINELVLPQFYFVLAAWLGIALPALLHMGACS